MLKDTYSSSHWQFASTALRADEPPVRRATLLNTMVVIHVKFGQEDEVRIRPSRAPDEATRSRRVARRVDASRVQSERRGRILSFGWAFARVREGVSVVARAREGTAHQLRWSLLQGHPWAGVRDALARRSRERRSRDARDSPRLARSFCTRRRATRRTTR